MRKLITLLFIIISLKAISQPLLTQTYRYGGKVTFEGDTRILDSVLLFTSGTDTMRFGCKSGECKLLVNKSLNIYGTVVLNDSVFIKQNALPGTYLTTDGSGYAYWDSINVTGGNLAIGEPITNANIGSILFSDSNRELAQDSANLFWDNVNKRMGIGTIAGNSSRVLIRGEDATSSNYALRVQNNAVTPAEIFNVRNDEFVGINTNTPLLSLPIGGTINSFSVGIPTVTNAGLNINDRGVAYRRDVNGLVWLDYSNQNASGSSAVVIRMSNNTTQASATIAKTGNLYSPNQFGNEPQSLVFLNKAPSNNRMKFSLLSVDTVTNSYFDWLTGDTGGASLPSDGNVNGGVSQTSSVMRLMGSGSLLVGTTTEISSSILTLNSATRGFLPPRMTTAQRDAIVSPAEGLVLYTTTDSSLNYRTGNLWNNIGSGIYTPTLTNVTNITSSVAYPCMYDVVGKKVNVSCQVGVEITSTGDYQIDISLPISSDFSNIYDCIGVGSSDSKNEYPQYIDADTTNNRARVHGNDNDATSHNHFINFSYYIK